MRLNKVKLNKNRRDKTKTQLLLIYPAANLTANCFVHQKQNVQTPCTSNVKDDP